MQTLVRVGSVILALILASILDADAEQRSDPALLAREVEAKIVRKRDESVRVSTEGCRFVIEFSNHEVIFQAPLKGTEVAENATANGIVLTNSALTRKFHGRSEEPYGRLILLFAPDELGRMIKMFQETIRSCEA